MKKAALILAALLLLAVAGGVSYWKFMRVPVTSVTGTAASSTASTAAALSCSLTFAPQHPHPGEPVTVQWKSTGADYASQWRPENIQPTDKKFSTTGSTTVVFDQYSGAFTLYFYGPTGTKQCSTGVVTTTGISERIYQLPGDVYLTKGAAASTADGAFGIRLDSIASDKSFKATVSILKNGVPNGTITFDTAESDLQKPAQGMNVRLCDIGFSTEHPEGAAEFLVGTPGQQLTCESREG